MGRGVVHIPQQRDGMLVPEGMRWVTSPLLSSATEKQCFGLQDAWAFTVARTAGETSTTSTVVNNAMQFLRGWTHSAVNLVHGRRECGCVTVPFTLQQDRFASARVAPHSRAVRARASSGATTSRRTSSTSVSATSSTSSRATLRRCTSRRGG